jgi:hypothetical protein
MLFIADWPYHVFSFHAIPQTLRMGDEQKASLPATQSPRWLVYSTK